MSARGRRDARPRLAHRPRLAAGGAGRRAAGHRLVRQQTGSLADLAVIDQGPETARMNPIDGIGKLPGRDAKTFRHRGQRQTELSVNATIREHRIQALAQGLGDNRIALAGRPGRWHLVCGPCSEVRRVAKPLGIPPRPGKQDQGCAEHQGDACPQCQGGAK